MVAFERLLLTSHSLLTTHYSPLTTDHLRLFLIFVSQQLLIEKPIHQGRNVKRFREMLGIKQEALALEPGDEWNQRKISLLEAKEEIEPELLEQVAKVLKVPADAIKNFDEEKAIIAIQNNYDNAIAHSNLQYQPTFSPLDKYVAEVEENKNSILLC